jgi:hypothetical protein
MDETYRMLGREHQADLEREALNRQRAAAVGRRRYAPAPVPDVARGRKRAQLALARVAALMSRTARAEA